MNTSVLETGRSRRRGFGVSLIARKCLQGGYAATVAFALVVYGGNTALALTMASSATFFLLIVAFLLIGQPARTRLPFWTALVLLCAVSFWAWLQAIPWTGEFAALKVWRQVTSFSHGVSPSLSVTPGDTVLGLLKIGLPFAVFMVSLILFDTDRRAIRVFKVMAIAGGVFAVFSILQFVFFPEFLLSETKRFYLDSLTGSFINRNTAGTFFGVVSVMLLTLMLHNGGKVEGRAVLALMDQGGRLVQPREITLTILYGFLFLAALTALFLTKSRGATGASFVAILAACFMMAAKRPVVRPHRSAQQIKSLTKRRLITLTALLVFLSVVFSILGERVQLRAEQQGRSDPRFCILTGAWSATVDNLPLGAGLTSFEPTFSPYRDPRCGVSGTWDKAHNFYLEGLLTLGVFFPIALLVCLFVLARSFVTGFRMRESRRYIVVAGMAATALVLIHAAVDFSLQIPGMAAYFAAVLGPAVTVCLGRARQGGAGALRDKSTG